MFEAAGPYFLRRSQSQGLLENYIDPAAGVAGNFLLSLPLERIGLKHISMPCSLPGSSLKGKYKRSPPCNLRKKHRFIPQCNLKKRGERRNTRVVFFFSSFDSFRPCHKVLLFHSGPKFTTSFPAPQTKQKRRKSRRISSFIPLYILSMGTQKTISFARWHILMGPRIWHHELKRISS